MTVQLKKKLNTYTKLKPLHLRLSATMVGTEAKSAYVTRISI